MRRFLGSPSAVLAVGVVCVVMAVPLVGSLVWPDAPSLLTSESLASRCSAASVTVRVRDKAGKLKSEGSGVLVVRGGVTYVWTVAHVVSAGGDGAGLSVVRVIEDGGAEVGRTEFDAELVRKSDAEDIAVLSVPSSKVGEGVRWAIARSAVGTPVAHVGSYLGTAGHNSYGEGSVAAVGRWMEGRVHDQTNVAMMRGSSGGGVFDRSGRCLGLIRGHYGDDHGFGFYVPARRVRAWAAKEDLLSAFDGE